MVSDAGALGFWHSKGQSSTWNFYHCIVSANRIAIPKGISAAFARKASSYPLALGCAPYGDPDATLVGIPARSKISGRHA